MIKLMVREVIKELAKPPGESEYSPEFLEGRLTVLSWFDGSQTGGEAFQCLNLLKLKKEGKQ